MRTDIAYEVIDSRKTKAKLGMVGIIKHEAGGLVVFSNNRRFVRVDLVENDDGLEFQDDLIILHTPDGTVILERLRIANYRSNVAPYYGEWRDFDDDEACARYFHDALLEID